MKSIKNFNDYVKENVETELAPVEVEGSALSDQMDEIESDFTEDDEEEYIGNKLMAELAKRLGVEVEDGQINYEGQLVDFYSETEMFHIGNKKFKTVDEAFDYLTDSKN